MIESLKKIIPKRTKILLQDVLGIFPVFSRTESYSQEGEDLILKRYFGSKEGFFIDVGANHPYIYSNTYLLYKLGWNGINIEPHPKRIKLFNKRKKDVNINIGIASTEQVLDFYAFEQTQISTFNREIAESNSEQGYNYTSMKIGVVPLSKIINDYEIKKIDLLNIDAEGFDYDVLLSIDWTKTKPIMIAIEEHGFKLSKLNKSKSYRLLEEQGYELYAKTNSTVFYLLTKKLSK